MKLVDREVVDGTRVTIGRKIHYRNTPDGPVRRTAKSYSAVYTEARQRRFQGLGTTNKREARRRAIEIQQRLDRGEQRTPPARATIAQLIDRYESFNRDRDLAPKTLAKYTADLDKLRRFCKESGITRADRFDEAAYARFGAWLREQVHKQGTSYAPKSNYTTLTVCKQMFKWAWRQRLAPTTSLASTRLPSARPRPQPCFMTEQVEAMLDRTDGLTHAAIAILAYTGLRVGELEQLHWALSLPSTSTRARWVAASALTKGSAMTFGPASCACARARNTRCRCPFSKEPDMLDAKVHDNIERSVLCWLATVSADGQPSVSPKDVFAALGSDSIIIASPHSTQNIRANPRACVSVVDVFVQ